MWWNTVRTVWSNSHRTGALPCLIQIEKWRSNRHLKTMPPIGCCFFLNICTRGVPENYDRYLDLTVVFYGACSKTRSRIHSCCSRPGKYWSSCGVSLLFTKNILHIPSKKIHTHTVLPTCTSCTNQCILLHLCRYFAVGQRDWLPFSAMVLALAMDPNLQQPGTYVV